MQVGTVSIPIRGARGGMLTCPEEGEVCAPLPKPTPTTPTNGTRRNRTSCRSPTARRAAQHDRSTGGSPGFGFKSGSSPPPAYKSHSQQHGKRQSSTNRQTKTARIRPSGFLVFLATPPLKVRSPRATKSTASSSGEGGGSSPLAPNPERTTVRTVETRIPQSIWAALASEEKPALARKGNKTARKKERVSLSPTSGC